VLSLFTLSEADENVLWRRKKGEGRRSEGERGAKRETSAAVPSIINQKERDSLEKECRRGKNVAGLTIP